MDMPTTLFDITRYVIPHVLVFDFARYFIAATLIFGIVWALRRTSLKTRKIQAREATKADMKREFLASLQTIGVYAFVTIFIIWGLRHGVLKSIQGDYGLWGNLGLLAAILVAHDAYFYWAHRTMHHPRLFKTFHRAHHRSITPTPFAAYSFAIPEAFVMALFLPLWQLFVATPGIVLFSFLAVMIIRNAMGHAGFELQPRWWLSTPLTRWINTTTHHDLHHAGSFNHNYGLYFTWWDKMMGTEHPEYHATFTRVVGPNAATAPAGLAPSPTL
jgi:Delta7-sterol 5-desaturase